MEKRNTKADFLTAFWQLYEKKDINKISIGELCRLAGYNRTTFYVYYKDIYDLLNKAVESIFMPIKEEIFSSLDITNVLENDIVKQLFSNILTRNEKQIELLFLHQHYLILAEKLKQEFLALIRKELKNEAGSMESVEYIFEYQLSALFGVIKYWFTTGKKLPESDLASLIYSISIRGALPSIRAALIEKPKIATN
ncbi:MAG: TetR/AcrR family transcriptional regulator [Emergencia timonensis]|uniref:TetR/AcrR family transcriptional regulator n=1 Tax=Emergencia timonensis TaxID=1776384 RepID=UPI00082AE359|nr:TetR/AcrR family transcriptional regulator [Emergencia timonensis]WNX87981.1 TetR/AcrR family transcriptional regulator [Emergencia timonensis]